MLLVILASNYLTILCPRQTCMVLGNLASNSSDYLVPNADVCYKETWLAIHLTILCLMQSCVVLGNYSSNSSDHTVSKTDMCGVRKLG